jgi:hypothetical protein
VADVKVETLPAKKDAKLKQIKAKELAAAVDSRSRGWSNSSNEG